MTFSLAAPAVERLLAAKETSDQPSADPTTTVYVLALRPHAAGRHARKTSLIERIGYFAARKLQPGYPTVVHTEVLLPLAGKPGIFSIYANDGGANWRPVNNTELNYYTVQNADSWLAVPLTVTLSDAERMQATASEAVGSSYSYVRYISSAWGIRQFARFLPSGGKKKGHCATITARVLKAATDRQLLKQHEAFYGPAALLQELHSSLLVPEADTAELHLAFSDELGAVRPMPFPQFNVKCLDPEGFSAVGEVRERPEQLADEIDLLRKSDKDVSEMPAESRLAAVESLVENVLLPQDLEARLEQETVLARALLRSRLL